MSTEAVPSLAASSLDVKREAAKEYLGSRWVNHPDYRFDPRHSNDPTICVPARQLFLLSVTAKATLDRLHNPAYQSAERFRHALSHHHH